MCAFPKRKLNLQFWGFPKITALIFRKIQKKIGQNLAKFSKFWQSLQHFLPAKIQQLLTKKLRLENDLRSWLSVSLPLRSVGTPSPLPRGSCFFNQETTSNLVQIPWNFVEGLCIAGNPNKGNSVISKFDQTEPFVLSSYPNHTRRLVTRPLL